MGKFLGGCLIVCLLLVAGGATVGYYVFVKPYTDMAGEAVVFAQELEALDSELAVRGPYQPPEDGAVPAGALQRYLAVQQRMRADLEGDMQTLQARYEALDDELESDQREASVAEIMTAYRDLGALYLEAKRAQVAALNEQRMSIDEYHWIRAQTYAALGQPVAVAAPEGSGQAQVSRVSPETRELVEAHRETLTDNYAFVWFGL